MQCITLDGSETIDELKVCVAFLNTAVKHSHDEKLKARAKADVDELLDLISGHE